MREIYYNSNITPQVTNEIKLLALYYDKINIVNDAVYSPKFDTSAGQFKFAGTEAFEFIPKTFRTDYKLLLDENIISITKRDEKQEDEYEKLFAKKISDILNSNYSIIFPKHPTEEDSRIITKEVYDVMKYMFDFDWEKPVERELVWWYYSFKLKWFLKLLLEGKSCISSSGNLNYLFDTFINESTKLNHSFGARGYNKSFALDALKIGLPNPDTLAFEDILELKQKLKDELAQFYQTINSIEVKYKERFNSGILDNEYQSIFFDEIKQPLANLKIRMKNLKSKTFRTFIDKMQNPKSYVPLVGTIVASIPLHFALLASFGLTAGQSYLEYMENKREVTNNGLYLLLKLK